MDKKKAMSEKDMIVLREKIEPKKRKYFTHPFIRLMSSGPYRDIVQNFAGVWCCYPIQYIMIEALTKDSKFLLEIMLRGVGGSWEEVGKVPAVETIGLYRWYEWILSFCVRVPTSYTITRRSVSPYSTLNTLEDIIWRFSDEYGFADGHNQPGHWSKDYEWNGYIDMIVMREHLGEIKINDVKMNKLNVIRPIIGGRWDIADKYVRRGDAKSPRDFTGELSKDQMEELLRRHDMWNVFLDVTYNGEFEESFLGGGILTMTAAMGGISPICEYVTSTPSIPMNIVEDIFTILIANYNKDEFLKEGVSVMDVVKRFSCALQDNKRPKPPSSVHRAYSSKYIERIISLIRGNHMDKATDLIENAALHDEVRKLNVPKWKDIRTKW